MRYSQRPQLGHRSLPERASHAVTAVGARQTFFLSLSTGSVERPRDSPGPSGHFSVEVAGLSIGRADTGHQSPALNALAR